MAARTAEQQKFQKIRKFMKSGMFSESAALANHTEELEQLARYILAQIRGAQIEERVESGFSRATAEDFIDFAWLARGWPVLCEEQRQNIERWWRN